MVSRLDWKPKEKTALTPSGRVNTPATLVLGLSSSVSKIMHPQKPIALSRTDFNLIVMLGYVLTHTPKTHSAVAGLKKRQTLFGWLNRILSR